jgi:hypothetical protein
LGKGIFWGAEAQFWSLGALNWFREKEKAGSLLRSEWQLVFVW